MSVRRRASADGARDWLVVPSLRHPRWLLPAGSPQASQALVRHDLGQRMRRLPSLVATLYSRLPVERLPLARVSVLVPAGADTIETELAELFGDPVSLCIRLGRDRQGRALVLRTVDETGTTRGFAKLASTAEGARAIEAEAENLRRVGATDISPVVAPRVLALTSWNSRPLLVMTALLPPREPAQHKRLPEQEMLKLAVSGGTDSVQLRQAAFVDRLRRDIRQLQNEEDRRVLGTALDTLLNHYGDRPVSLGCWHGDWAPWNMAWAGTRIQLWDWEHYEGGVPVGWDWLHFTAQDLRNRKGCGPQVEAEWLESASAFLRRAVSADAGPNAAVLLCYLLVVNVRYLKDRHGQDGAPARNGWGLPLIARLTRELPS